MSKKAVADLTGWLDYDRAHLAALDARERIDYFEKRVRLVAIKPARRIFERELHGQPGSSALLIFAVAVCCSIEALGKFFTGDSGGNGDQFHAFLKEYMNPGFDKLKLGRDTYGRILWKHFRNGLAHGFAVSHGGFQGEPGQPYFEVVQICGVDCLEINPTAFIEDYEQAFDRYVGNLRSASSATKLVASFEKVFERVFVKGL